MRHEMKRYPRCRYHGEVCYVVHQHANGDLVIATHSENLARQEVGWEGVDKCEWEKTVSPDEVRMLDALDSS